MIVQTLCSRLILDFPPYMGGLQCHPYRHLSVSRSSRRTADDLSGFVFTTAAVVLSIAAAGIFVSILTAVIAGSIFLVPVLFITTLVSLTIITGLLSLFLLHRLIIHLSASTTGPDGKLAADYTHVSQGVRAWAHETTNRLPEVPFDTRKVPLVGSYAAPMNKPSNTVPGRPVSSAAPHSAFTSEKSAPNLSTAPLGADGNPTLTRPVTVETGGPLTK